MEAATCGVNKSKRYSVLVPELRRLHAGGKVQVQDQSEAVTHRIGIDSDVVGEFHSLPDPDDVRRNPSIEIPRRLSLKLVGGSVDLDHGEALRGLDGGGGTDQADGIPQGIA